MKAALLYEVGTSLKVEEVAEPDLKPGGVIVRVLASHVPNDLLQMIAAGTLNVSAIKTHVFPLNDVNEAVSKAATLRGLEYSIVVPSNSF